MEGEKASQSGWHSERCTWEAGSERVTWSSGRGGASGAGEEEAEGGRPWREEGQGLDPMQTNGHGSGRQAQYMGRAPPIRGRRGQSHPGSQALREVWMLRQGGKDIFNFERHC